MLDNKPNQNFGGNTLKREINPKSFSRLMISANGTGFGQAIVGCSRHSKTTHSYLEMANFLSKGFSHM